jgi:peptidoglycan/xylan/chitin deacetylase (PgdA/CDA1 family)
MIPVWRSPALAVLAALAAIMIAGCGGSGGSAGGSGGGSAGASGGRSRGAALTPGGGRGATAPPVNGSPATPSRTVPELVPPSNPTPRSIRVPVLTYHRVVTEPAAGQPDLKIDPGVFLAELQAIKRAGYHTISQAQLFDALYRGAALPARPVMLTFDDGYVDDIRTILPDLERLHMVATFFVITGRVTEPGFLTNTQIRELDAAGMDIGDHTAHHVDLRLLTALQLKTETLGSRRALQRTLGHFVYAFAYPFGAFNTSVVAAVRAAGYTLAYTTAGGATESTSAPLTMPRIHVGRSETPSGLVSLLGG